jgi:hypothetical protein
MNNISKPDTECGIISNICYASIFDIESFQIMEDLTAQIVFKTDKSWNSIYSTSETPKITSDTKIEAGKTLYLHTLIFILPKFNISTIRCLFQIQKNNEPIIILLKYSNEQQLIMGSIEQPANLISDFSSERFKTFHTITIQWKSNHQLLMPKEAEIGINYDEIPNPVY